MQRLYFIADAQKLYLHKDLMNYAVPTDKLPRMFGKLLNELSKN